MRLLKKIHDHRQTNMMKASNLSIVFSPTLLKPREEDHEVILKIITILLETIRVRILVFLFISYS